MVELVREAQALGHLRGDVDVERLAFELYAYLELANYHFVLFRDPAVLDRGRGGGERSALALRCARTKASSREA